MATAVHAHARALQLNYDAEPTDGGRYGSVATPREEGTAAAGHAKLNTRIKPLP
jgi:hypothetical protein